MPGRSLPRSVAARRMALLGCLTLCGPAVAVAAGAGAPPPASPRVLSVDKHPVAATGAAATAVKAGHTAATTALPQTTRTAPLTRTPPSSPTVGVAIPAANPQAHPPAPPAERPAAPGADEGAAGDEPGPERIVWDRTPIRLVLPVGRERMIHFPAPVRVGVPQRIDTALRTQSIDGTVYLKAARPFAGTRVMVRETDTGYTYLFDIAAAPSGGSTRPVEIHAPHRPVAQVEEADADQAVDGEAGQAAANFGYVALTRFAAQQLYGPRRLARDLPGILRAPVTDAPVALMRGGRVRAVPLVGWQAGGLYVTAVKLTNTRHRPVVLDPRDLRGRWLAATFQHARVLRHGDEADTTCVYLISARPFDAAAL